MCTTSDSTSCEAATRAKPKASLCEPWVTVEKIFEPRSGDRLLSGLFMIFALFNELALSDAAPRLRNTAGRVTQGSQSLALGLTLAAASQLFRR